MSAREDLLVSISSTTQDYRDGDIPAPTPEHVDRWIRQFKESVQLPILREMDHVLQRTYFSLKKVTVFLEGLIQTERLVGKDPCVFWRRVHFLDIQDGGNSQTEMLSLFDGILQERCGFGIEHCGGDDPVYLYLDDGIFTGNRVRRDLETWVRNHAPVKATLHVVSIALHKGGQHYARGHITDVATVTGKSLNVTWWRAIILEDRKKFSDTADVLRPTSIPNDTAVQAYVAKMQYEPTLRSPGNVGENNLFTSDQGKGLLEQEFLKAGTKIRQMCPNLGATQRPLGHMTLNTLGFGSLIVTFRNCPNNAPLVLWVGDPWYALFPRTTNSQTAIKRLLADMMKV